MSLAIAKRVGEVQAVSGTVSFICHDASLSYVPEFVTKMVFISNPLPRSFLVASWSGFAAGLDDELLLYLSGLPPFFSSWSSFSVPGMTFSGFVEDFRFFLPTGGNLGTGAASPEVGSVGAYRVWGVSTSAAFLVT